MNNSSKNLPLSSSVKSPSESGSLQRSAEAHRKAAHNYSIAAASCTDQQALEQLGYLGQYHAQQAEFFFGLYRALQPSIHNPSSQPQRLNRNVSVDNFNDSVSHSSSIQYASTSTSSSGSGSGSTVPQRTGSYSNNLSQVITTTKMNQDKASGNSAASTVNNQREAIQPFVGDQSTSMSVEDSYVKSMDQSTSEGVWFAKPLNLFPDSGSMHSINANSHVLQGSTEQMPHASGGLPGAQQTREAVISTSTTTTTTVDTHPTGSGHVPVPTHLPTNFIELFIKPWEEYYTALQQQQQQQFKNDPSVHRFLQTHQQLFSHTYNRVMSNAATYTTPPSHRSGAASSNESNIDEALTKLNASLAAAKIQRLEAKLGQLEEAYKREHDLRVKATKELKRYEDSWAKIREIQNQRQAKQQSKTPSPSSKQP